ncbi:hypothetical protein QBC42DRAFT_289295 [Cladorrhinum samala]|uniref:Uncharacterized protein n=1 Tax=Cladorrhinum samala TaxID=585594 RepID=A0AAV9HIP3_9PEZI|nr:hypothetical protein QBC42DRAFT_289295 [Cladorrhinum samala]
MPGSWALAHEERAQVLTLRRLQWRPCSAQNRHGKAHERQWTTSFSDAENGRHTDGQFLKEFGNFLAEHQLDRVLGLGDLDQRDPKLNVEVTEGKANIMMPRGSVPESELIQVRRFGTWGSTTHDDDRCNCHEHCHKDSKGRATLSTEKSSPAVEPVFIADADHLARAVDFPASESGPLLRSMFPRPDADFSEQQRMR